MSRTVSDPDAVLARVEQFLTSWGVPAALVTPGAKTLMATIKEPSAMLDVNDIAFHLKCSKRQVHRLVTDGRFPAGMLVGGMRRWPRATLDWIREGMPTKTLGR